MLTVRLKELDLLFNHEVLENFTPLKKFQDEEGLTTTLFKNTGLGVEVEWELGFFTGDMVEASLISSDPNRGKFYFAENNMTVLVFPDRLASELIGKLVDWKSDLKREVILKDQ